MRNIIIDTDTLDPEEHRKIQYNCSHPDSWVWNEDQVAWIAPKEYPSDGYPYIWDEDQLNWVPFPDYPRNQ